MRKKFIKTAIFLLFGLSILSQPASAQTPAFSYQGRLTDGGNTANGSFQMQFKVYDSLAGTTQIGPTLTNVPVTVTQGVFSVKLDFGTGVFSGAHRWLEIGVRRNSGESYVTLSPREQIASAPYAVHTLSASFADDAGNAFNLGGVAANQFVQTGDGRLSDARNPLPNSPNYIQNGITEQTGSNFNISGGGTVGGTLTANGVNALTHLNVFGNGNISGTLTSGVVNAATQFNLNGARIIRDGGTISNMFVGVDAGVSNVDGDHNSYFGFRAGFMTTIGGSNSFFGAEAGERNTGGANSFFGSSAGAHHVGGNYNSFFGHRAGDMSTGNLNSFFGTGAGLNNSNGNSNSFFGHDAGNYNAGGSFNTVVGENADLGLQTLTNATAIGSKALVNQSNSLVLGSINGINGATASTNVGVGTPSPLSRLDVRGDILLGLTSLPDIANSNSLFLANDLGDPLNSLRVEGHGNNLYLIARSHASSTSGTGIIFRTSTAGQGEGDRVVIKSNGVVQVNNYATDGQVPLCHNSALEIATCSSSLRYKTNVATFGPGLDLIKRLRPVSFNWRLGGVRDLGLVAEEVAETEPLLTTVNAKGEIEGVKYDRVGVVLVNAVNEQQQQIEAQAEVIRRQQSQINALMKLVCASNALAEICKEK